MKIIFAPVGIIVGLLAGLAAQKVFERLWALFDKEDPPGPERRDISYPKLVGALLLEGGIFRLVKGLVDHGSRAGFARMTGVWPGDEGDSHPLSA